MSDRAQAVALRALGLGDMLTAIPAFRAIERAFPECDLWLAAPREFQALLDLAGLRTRIVDTVGLATVPAVPTKPWLAINLHGKGPESHLALLALQPRRLVAFHHPGIGNPGPRWDETEHDMQRWCRLLVESGIPADPMDHLITPAPPAPIDPPDTVIHPGAAYPARRWPVERWVEVARWEREHGHSVVVTGSGMELDQAREVAAGAGLPPSAVLAGRTDLVSLAGLIGAAGILVCGDTGVAHLATALGTPSVLLFGPTSPARWGPPPGGRQRVIWKGEEGNPHAPSPDPGLLAITPDEVIESLHWLRDEGARLGHFQRGA